MCRECDNQARSTKFTDERQSRVVTVHVGR